MMKSLSILVIATSLLIFSSCKSKKNDFDASGAFEAEEILISSEASGTIKQFNIEEGQTLKAGQMIGYIDSIQLFLKKKQLEAQINALNSKKPNVSVQLASLEEQLKTAEREQKRIDNLVKANAGTAKQLDDINAQVEILKKQIEAQRSSLDISSGSISKDALPLKIQIEQINDQLEKCKIINPVNGTVLAKYVEANEMSSPGKPLYKIANLSTIILRAYITGDQMSSVKLNQIVKVLTDDGKGGYKETGGTITMINDKAEFTPKTIQTKDERANLVYAIKVNVKNDGSYKIGMYGEIKFQ
jgi:HlyD family secretion protein